MPLYEYKCDGCGREFEIEQRITAAPGAECPHCGGKKVRRLISSTAFHLKGGGWYVTDYCGSKQSASGDTSSSDSKAAGSEGGCSSSGGCPAASSCPSAPKK